MLQHVSRDIRGLVTSTTLAIAYLEMIEQQFVGSNKAKADVLIQKFTSVCYTGKGNVREYIMVIRGIAGKPNDLKITISNSFLVHFILQILPPEYNLFKVSYNTHKDEWSINELMTKCVQEKERKAVNPLVNKMNVVNLANHESGGHASKGKKL